MQYMIQIKVFPDKVMMFNNCIFPVRWTVENLFKSNESKSINPLIAYEFYMMGYIDVWGRDIDKIASGLKEAGQEMPVFDESTYSFCITLKPKFLESDILNEKEKSQKSHKKVTKKILLLQKIWH